MADRITSSRATAISGAIREINNTEAAFLLTEKPFPCGKVKAEIVWEVTVDKVDICYVIVASENLYNNTIVVKIFLYH